LQGQAKRSLLEQSGNPCQNEG